MLTLITWTIFGLIVGIIAKLIHPGDEPVGFLPTIGIGIAGSFLGGILLFILNLGQYRFHPSGLLMSILGGVLCCVIWKWYVSKSDA